MRNLNLWNASGGALAERLTVCTATIFWMMNLFPNGPWRPVGARGRFGVQYGDSPRVLQAIFVITWGSEDRLVSRAG